MGWHAWGCGNSNMWPPHVFQLQLPTKKNPQVTLTFATLAGWCEPLARALGGAARAPASSRVQAWQTGLSSEGSCGRRMSSFSSRWEGPDPPRFCFPQPPSSPCGFGVWEKPSPRRSWPMPRARRRDLLSSSSCLSSRQFGRWTRRWAP